MILSLIIAVVLVYVAYKIGYSHGTQDTVTVKEVVAIMQEVKKEIDKW